MYAQEWLTCSAEAKKLLPSGRFGFRCDRDLFAGKVFQMTETFESENKKKEKRAQNRISHFHLIVKLGKGTVLPVRDESIRVDYTLALGTTGAAGRNGRILSWQQFLDLIPVVEDVSSASNAGAAVTPNASGKRSTNWKNSLKRGVGSSSNSRNSRKEGMHADHDGIRAREQQAGTTPIPFNQGRALDDNSSNADKTTTSSAASPRKRKRAAEAGAVSGEEGQQSSSESSESHRPCLAH